MDNRTDIITKEDITRLITDFYTKVRQDDVIAHHFTNIDWNHHTPVIIDFWAMLLLGDPSYRGNPLAKHFHLNLKKEDFTRWLLLFRGTVDEHFKGEKAEEAKQRAENIASVFQFKMGLLTNDRQSIL